MATDAERLRFFRALCTRSRANAKQRGIAHSITPEDLLERWHVQEGCCYYTGRTLVLEQGRGTLQETCNQVGIERVRSGRGYFKSNVRLVGKAANYMKNALDRAEFFRLCVDIVKKWNLS